MSIPLNDSPRVSVIIGFKDWGLERLELSVRSIHGSLSGIPHEVVISDYGSVDAASIAETAARIDARHEIVTTEGEWSRSRALNAGVRASRGDFILATDADMLFSPGALDRVVAQLERHPQEVVILQCRDLPTGYSHEAVSRDGFDWERFAAIGQIRPRWGMGGLVGIRREIWDRLRGWDERMHTYGGEDIDLGKRAQMYGARIDWLDEPGVAMYHIWHPSSGASASRSPEAVAAIAENRRIHSEDRTFARNRIRPRYLPFDLPPLVSVVVDAGHKDGDLDATLATIVSQSIRDIEVQVIGVALPEESDPRVKEVSTDGAAPRGTFVTVARPGEIWADDHLETLLGGWKPGVGIISVHSAELLVDSDGEALDSLRVLESDAPDPRATLVRTSLHSDPGGSLLAGHGWVEAVGSVAATGAEWVALPDVRHITVSTVDNEEHFKNERSASAVALRGVLSRCGLPAPEVPDALLTGLGVRANAALYGRRIALYVDAIGAVDVTKATALATDSGSWESSSIRTRGGAVLRRAYVWMGEDLRFALRAEQELEALGARVTAHYADDSVPARRTGDSPADLARAGEEAYGNPRRASIWFATKATGETCDSIQRELMSLPSVTVVLDRVVETQGEETLWLLARYRDSNLSDAWATAGALVGALAGADTISVIELPTEQETPEATK